MRDDKIFKTGLSFQHYGDARLVGYSRSTLREIKLSLEWFLERIRRRASEDFVKKVFAPLKRNVDR